VEKYLWAFLVGGAICVIGQILLDGFKLTPAHTTCILVVTGAIMGGLGLYDPLIKFAGAGASVPISSFGNSLVKGALQEFEFCSITGNIGNVMHFSGSYRPPETL